MYDSLELVLLLLAMAVVVVVTFRILNLPETIGYLLVGVCVGPNAFGLIPDSISARHLAEFGIVFLMFSIGLEFSLSKLLTMKRIVFGYGFLQVVFSTGVFYLIGIYLLGKKYLKLQLKRNHSLSLFLVSCPLDEYLIIYHLFIINALLIIN